MANWTKEGTIGYISWKKAHLEDLANGDNLTIPASQNAPLARESPLVFDLG